LYEARRCRFDTNLPSLGVLSLLVRIKISTPRLFSADALRTPEERLPSGAPKEEFGRMIFQKNLPWGTVLDFGQRRRQVFVEAAERVTPRVY